MTPRVLRYVARTLLLIGGAGACRDARPSGPAATPDAEFLIATGDSTYWVRSGPRGLSVRSSPLLLTHDGTRFHEIYVSDEDRVWPDAVFVAQRLWRRDLVTGDSIELARDSTILRLASRYASAHRDVPLLAPEDELPEDPQVDASSEFEVIDVHGAHLSWLRHVDVDGLGDAEHRHEATWRVTDVRTGAPLSYQAIFGAAVGDALEARAARAFASTRDSLSGVASGHDAAAREALAALRFDPLSYSLGDRDGAPLVLPMASAPDARGRAIPLALQPVNVPSPAPDWWTATLSLLPRVTPDSSALSWQRPGYRVIARFDSAHDRLRVSLAPAQAGAEEVVVGMVPGPAWSLMPLDGPAVDSVARTALSRAFHESQEYGGEAQPLAVRAVPGARVASMPGIGAPSRRGRVVPVRRLSGAGRRPTS